MPPPRPGGRQWRIEGRREEILASLRARKRVGEGREPAPSAGVLDSRSVQAAERGGRYGYDRGKKVPGTKRHLLVDTSAWCSRSPPGSEATPRSSSPP
ncbi:transposase [Streptomyces sp. NPDC059788]|uniref:transposase n=1 Tax=Streptomyces sp. NPDC059788 TaxID=3346948 RepID=UPI00365CE2FE